MSQGTNKPVVGISIGDINGIGPEIIMEVLDDNRVTKYLTPVIYASGGLISYFRKLLDKPNFNFHQSRDIEGIHHKKVNVIQTWDEKVEVTPGNPNPSGGTYALKSLDAATEDLKNHKIDALVTAPISKDLVQGQGFTFPGHTEYLAEKLGSGSSLMLMIDEEIRIGVATGHIALQEVGQTLTPELLSNKLNMLIESLKGDFAIKKPKVAVLGLNPHAGENGKIGTEDRDLIKPIVDDFKNKGHLVFGPYPADGFFGSSQYLSFDGIMAMYHDQGLIPFKLLCSSQGVNFTAGLPGIRTSPAHGTAFNLAGKKVADPTSMRNALFLAAEMVKSRPVAVRED